MTGMLDYPPPPGPDEGERGIRGKSNEEVARWLSGLASHTENATDRVVLNEAARRLAARREDGTKRPPPPPPLSKKPSVNVGLWSGLRGML